MDLRTMIIVAVGTICLTLTITHVGATSDIFSDEPAETSTLLMAPAEPVPVVKMAEPKAPEVETELEALTDEEDLEALEDDEMKAPEEEAELEAPEEEAELEAPEEEAELEALEDDEMEAPEEEADLEAIGDDELEGSENEAEFEAPEDVEELEALEDETPTEPETLTEPEATVELETPTEPQTPEAEENVEVAPVSMEDDATPEPEVVSSPKNCAEAKADFERNPMQDMPAPECDEEGNYQTYRCMQSHVSNECKHQCLHRLTGEVINIGSYLMEKTDVKQFCKGFSKSYIKEQAYCLERSKEHKQIVCDKNTGLFTYVNCVDAKCECVKPINGERIHAVTTEQKEKALVYYGSLPAMCRQMGSSLTKEQLII